MAPGTRPTDGMKYLSRLGEESPRHRDEVTTAPAALPRPELVGGPAVSGEGTGVQGQ